MRQVQVAVIVAAVAAIGLFLLRGGPERTPGDESLTVLAGGTRNESTAERDTGGEPAGKVSQAAKAARRAAGSLPKEHAESSRGRRRDGGDFRVARDSDTPHGQAQTLAAAPGGQRRVGRISAHGSRRWGLRGEGSGASIASGGRPARRRGLPDFSGVPSRAGQEVVTGQPLDEVQVDAYADAGAEEELREDVLLSVPLDGTTEAEDFTAPLIVKDLVIDGDGMKFTEDSVLMYPANGNVRGDAGSISFAIEPDWDGSEETNNALVQIRQEHVWKNRLQLAKNFNSLRFIFIDNTGSERNVNIYIDDWVRGEQHTVTATWGDALIALYVDGAPVGQNTYPGTFQIPPNTPIHIGSDYAGSAYSGAGGTIRDFKVYGRALSAEEIAGF